MTKKSSSRHEAGAKGLDDVEAYLAKLPPNAKATLEKLRDQIRRIAPESEEGLSYGVPAFKLGGKPIVCYAAFKHHCGFYPMSPAVISAHADDLKDYETAKGTIRFPIDKPLPAALVKKLVNARIMELQRGDTKK